MNAGAAASMSAIMLFAGFVIPVMAALNAGLGVRIGAPGAACVLFFVALIAAGAVMIMTGGLPLARLQGVPPQFFLGGVLNLIYVLSITAIAPRIGVGNAVFLVLLGQLFSTAMIDHFGLFGALKTSLDGKRIAGLAFMALGVFLARRV